MTSVVRRPLSVVELQAALGAAWRGDFAPPGRQDTCSDWGEAPSFGAFSGSTGGGRELHLRFGRRSAGSVSEGGAAPSEAGVMAHPAFPDGGRPGNETPQAGRRVIVVAGAHSGAGASTVALLLADTSLTSGVPTRLEEWADPARSGLACATDAELGESGGWRHGRRGALLIDRLAEPMTTTAPLPDPVDARTDPGERVVLDANWQGADLVNGVDRARRRFTDVSVVAVCRATVPGIRQLEHVLGSLNEVPAIAVIGPARWPGVLHASCGPLLRTARAAGQVVAVPVDASIQLRGLTAAPLPKKLLAAGSRLWAQLETEADAAASGALMNRERVAA